MDAFLLVLAVICALTGIIGSILPALPGPPVSYLGLLLVQWAIQPYSTTLLVVTAVITLLIVVFDYFLPIMTAKKFGATKEGVWGSVIGMTLGLFFTPVGMITGLIAGAILGDLIAGRTLKQSAVSASGTVFGTLLTIGIKLIWCSILLWYIFSRIFQHAFPDFSLFN